MRIDDGPDPAEYRSYSLLAFCCFIGGLLFFIVIRDTKNFSGLYADGVFFFYNILNSHDYFYATFSRSVAYWLTQTPVVLSVKLGATDMVLLARLHSAGLVVVPTTILFTAFLIARKSMVLLAGTAIILASVYIPTSLFHIGEFQVSYPLFWLIFLLLISDYSRGPLVAIALSVLVAFAYEASSILGLEVAAISVWRALRTTDGARRYQLYLCAVALFAGAIFNFGHALFAPVVENARAHFIHLVLHPAENAAAWYMFAASLISALAAVLMRERWRWLAVVIAFLATLLGGWGVLTANNVVPAFGLPYLVRAASFVILGATILLAFLAVELGLDFTPDTPGCIAISLPILLAFGVDQRIARGWPVYLHHFCIELERTVGESEAIKFHKRVGTRRYGWMWTDPITSRVLSSAENTGVILNVGGEFPPGPLDNLVGYKHGRLICDSLP